MGSLLVVLLDPLLGLLSDFMQALKQVHIECRFPIAPIESFNETILHRFAGFDELECHAMIFGPISQRDRYEFWAVVPSKSGCHAQPFLAYGDSAQRTLNEGAAKHDGNRLYRKGSHSGSD